ncbi:MAG TPA: RNase H family protein [Tangfeifania sp.]|nr:RNase H family protein [Tangfeifania sp.]
MNELLLFTDGSVNTKTKAGVGAYLAVDDPEISTETLKNQVKTRQFENTSSTRLELETLLWALDEISSSATKISVYTDSQNITGLLRRRERLEKNDFRSKNDRLMNNHDLYREFYRKVDQLNCEFVKVAGHQPTRQKDKIHRLFTLVDRASRKALRKNSS